MKKIKFITTPSTDALVDYPQPASKNLPEWYKKSNRFMFGDKKPGLIKESNTHKNTTLKACMPFRDAMTTGYIWTLPTDLEITKFNKTHNIKWAALEGIVSNHQPEQVPNFPNPMKTDTTVFKFNCDFVAKPPKGYSILYTHPLNRHDLPFRTFSGVVESDSYNLPVNFPFQLIVFLEEDEKLIIPKGTPIIQFIPIKRENWYHKKVVEQNPYARLKTANLINGTLVNAYKNLFWVKKTYN
jgi:uncharacterized protein involved in tolerance to divalent cations